MKNFTKIVSRYLLILFPPVFFFSYYPIISLAESESMNYELSLPEIWLVLFFLLSLPQLKNIYHFYGVKKLGIAVAIPIYLSLAVIWSENRSRTILTAGLFWLLVFAGLNLIYYLKTDKTNKLRNSLIKSLLISAVAISIFCWIQCILDVIGVPRDATLLCRGCISTTFGFPHPSGFAIEPQFMGNLLLAPVLLCFYLLSKNFKTRKRSICLILLTLFLTATLFLTLSRGAIYAFLLALTLMLVLIRKKPAVIKSLTCASFSLILALVSFGVFSAVGPTNDTFLSGTTKAIHQLTLGKIDLRPDEAKTDAKTAPSSSETEPQSQSIAGAEQSVSTVPSQASSALDDTASHFSGYVAESTDTRLGLNSLAIKTWTTSAQYIIVGAGLGSAGSAMHKAFPAEIGPKEIVQNEYVSLLLETGIFGIVVIALVVIFTTVHLAKRKLLRHNSLFVSVVFGFALTLLFFSGLPNALHLYLFPLLFFNFNLRAEDNFLVADKV